MRDRVIFHCDCDSFFASVEETFHPEYKQVPMAVAGDPENRRGIILAKNQLAKGFGIKTAETIYSAKRKCPQLLLVPPRHGVYRDFCQRINAIYTDYTDQVEPFSIDESFLDVTASLHLFGGDPVELAHQIRRRVQREIGVTISVGVSWNKTFAKIASDLRKPNDVCAVTRENVRSVLWPLPVSSMFLVGENTAEKLLTRGIGTIGDLAQADETFLTKTLGKIGAELRRCAGGLDDRPVRYIWDNPPPQSIGNGMTFRRNLVSEQDIRTGVIALADSVARRLRKADLKCNTLQVTIKDTALKSIQRQKSTGRPTYLAADLTRTAMAIILAHWDVGKPIRLLTLTAQNLVPASEAGEQLTLFGDPGHADSGRSEQLERAMDRIREKYGSHSIQPGVILHNDLGIRDKEDEDTP